jgi:hypothetical protein
MTNETELIAKLRMGAARQSGVVNTNARLRYLAGDFPGIVFESEKGNLRFSAQKDPENFANKGTISSAKIEPHRPSDGWKATVSYYHADDHAQKVGKLWARSKSEAFNSPEVARQWFRDLDVFRDETRSETIEDYRHNDCDTVSLDLVDGDASFACYVIGERDDRLILSRPQNPEKEAYHLLTGKTVRLEPIAKESPEVDPWSPDHDPTKQYEVRKYWRHSPDE